jgi:abequosyltransferase
MSRSSYPDDGTPGSPSTPSRPSLSICIPTHHGWARFIEQALEGLVAQLTPAIEDRIEICVSDNASHDETEAIVRAIAARPGVRLVYSRNDRDRGVSFNIARTIEIASGDYCWLHSSDDRLARGALARALELLDATPDTAGMTVNRMTFDLTLNEEILRDPPKTLPFDADRLSIFESLPAAIVNCGMLMSYLTAQIVDRRLWIAALAEIESRPVPAMEYFIHAAVIGTMLEQRPVWIWCPEPLAQCRFGHSCLAEDGDSMHLAPVFAWQLAQLWMHLLGRRSAEYRLLIEHVRDVWATPAAIRLYQGAAKHSPRRGFLLLVRFTIVFRRCPGFWTTTLPRLLVGPRAVRVLGPLRKSGVV